MSRIYTNLLRLTTLLSLWATLVSSVPSRGGEQKMLSSPAAILNQIFSAMGSALCQLGLSDYLVLPYVETIQKG